MNLEERTILHHRCMLRHHVQFMSRLHQTEQYNSVICLKRFWLKENLQFQITNAVLIVKRKILNPCVNTYVKRRAWNGTNASLNAWNIEPICVFVWELNWKNQCVHCKPLMCFVLISDNFAFGSEACQWVRFVLYRHSPPSSQHQQRLLMLSLIVFVRFCFLVKTIPIPWRQSKTWTWPHNEIKK